MLLGTGHLPVNVWGVENYEISDKGFKPLVHSHISIPHSKNVTEKRLWYARCLDSKQGIGRIRTCYFMPHAVMRPRMGQIKTVTLKGEA